MFYTRELCRPLASTAYTFTPLLTSPFNVIALIQWLTQMSLQVLFQSPGFLTKCQAMIFPQQWRSAISGQDFLYSINIISSFPGVHKWQPKQNFFHAISHSLLFAWVVAFLATCSVANILHLFWLTFSFWDAYICTCNCKENDTTRPAHSLFTFYHW